eukprot:403355519
MPKQLINSYKQIQNDKIRTSCIPTDLTSQNVKTYNQALIQSACYHKLHQELTEQLEDADSRIDEELIEAQIQLKNLAQELMDSDCIRAGQDGQILKLQNSLNINMVQVSRQNTGSLANISQSYNLREELKEVIMDELKKQATCTNFTNDQKITPICYERIIGQDQDKITKNVLKSDGIHPSLDNSYLTELELEPSTYTEARKLLQPQLFDMNFCVYDFKPVNPGFLLLQRLDYMTKQQKIKNYIRNQFRERVDEIKINNSVFVNQTQQWCTNSEIQKRTIDKQLKMRYPDLFDEFQLEQKHLTGIFSKFYITSNFLLLDAYPGYFPHLLGRATTQQVQNQDDDEEEWDDFQRFKDNKADISLNRFRLYKQFIHQEPSKDQLIKNPLEYELEYKKRMIWTIKDIETFLKAILENPPDFWQIGKYLPHKTSKELSFFYMAFKKLFNLKKHFQTLRVASGLPSQAVRSLSEPRRKIKEQEKIVDQKLSHYHFNTFKVSEYQKIEINEQDPIFYFEDVERRGNRILDFCQNQLSFENPDLSWPAQNMTAKISFYINLMQSSKQSMPQCQIKNVLVAKDEQQSLLRKRNFTEFFKNTGDRDISKLVLSKQVIEDYGHQNNKRQRITSSNIESQNFNSAQSPFTINQQSNVYEARLSDNNFSSYSLMNQANNSFPNLIQNNKPQHFYQSLPHNSFTEKYVENLNGKTNSKIMNYLAKRHQQQNLLVPQLSQFYQQQQNNQTHSSDNSISNRDLQVGTISAVRQQQNLMLTGDHPQEYATVERDKELLRSNQGPKSSNNQIIVIESSSENESQEFGQDDDEITSRQRKGLLQWQDDEKEKFILLLQKHGRDWNAIANELPRKTDKQCRNYFQNYKHKLNLQQYLSEGSMYLSATSKNEVKFRQD